MPPTEKGLKGDGRRKRLYRIPNADRRDSRDELTRQGELERVHRDVHRLAGVTIPSERKDIRRRIERHRQVNGEI